MTCAVHECDRVSGVKVVIRAGAGDESSGRDDDFGDGYGQSDDRGQLSWVRGLFRQLVWLVRAVFR